MPWPEKCTIRGRVFLDGNGDDRLSNGERVLEGAIVRAGDRLATTDEQGRYVLTELPAGTVRIELLSPTPEGWTAPPAMEIELGRDPERLQDVDLAASAR